MTYHPDQHTNEAKAKHAQRAAWRKAPEDPLRERVRIAQFWTRCNETNKHYGLVHSRAFFRSPCFLKYLMPMVREHIQSQHRAERQRYADELRQSAQRAAQAKALAKAGPMPLFEQVAA